MALRLANAERRLSTFARGQVDAIVDPEGRAYLVQAAQEQLRAREKQWNAVLESIADVVTVVNRGGLIVWQSPSVRPVLGYEPGELVGNSIFPLMHADDMHSTYLAYFQVIEGFAEFARSSFRLRTRAGGYGMMDAAVSRLRNAVPADGKQVVISMRPEAGER